MQSGGVVRIRVVDIPAGRSNGKHDQAIARVIVNLTAGIGPMEALEIEQSYASVQSAQYVAGKLRKEILRNSQKANVLVRETPEGDWKVYVTGI